jgi:hypothetical protein
MTGRRAEISPGAEAAAYATDPERRLSATPSTRKRLLSATPSTLMGAVVQSPFVPWVVQPGSVRIGGVSCLCTAYTAQRKHDCDQAGGWVMCSRWSVAAGCGRGGQGPFEMMDLRV